MVLNSEDVEPGAQLDKGRLAGVQLGSDTAGRAEVASYPHPHTCSVLSLCLLSPLLTHNLLLGLSLSWEVQGHKISKPCHQLLHLLEILYF